MQIKFNTQNNITIPSFRKKFNTQPIINGVKQDVFKNSKHFEMTQIRNIYNNLWKELSLPENLKPKIQLSNIFSDIGFSLDDYAIYLKKSFINKPLKMKIENKTGRTKALLRHEIEHVKQMWGIIRLLGAENIQNEFDSNVRGMSLEVKPHLLKKMREIEKNLGKLTPDEETQARKNLKSLRNYPDINKPYGFFDINGLINYIKYHFNGLEIEARKSEKEYFPSIFSTIKTLVKEFLQI